jgi:S-(hydroxymethyl)glutathione dehydrogenase/alcohol dehydrogenase
MAMVGDGRLALDGLISRRFSLEEADDAYGALARGEIVGRAVIELTADA